MSGTRTGRLAGLGPSAATTGRRALRAAIPAALSFALLVALVQRLDVPVVLGGAVLLVAGLAMLVRPEVATLLTVFLLYLNFPAILTKQHGLPHVVAGSFILLLGFPLLDALIVRRESLKADSTFHLMLALLAVYLLSSLRAADTGVALGAVREYVLEGLLLYALIFNVVRTLATLRRVIWTVLATGALLSALSLYQTVTGDHAREFGGLAYRNYELIQDEPEREGPARRQTWDRARGPVDEPNRFAQTLLVLVPLAVAMFRGGRTPLARAAAAAAGLLLVGGVLTTLSRGGFLTLVVLTVLMVAARWMRASRVLALAVVLALAAPSIPFFQARITQTAVAFGLVDAEVPASARQIDSASLIRMTVMVAAARVFLDHPVLGVGPGQFGPIYSQAYSRDPAVNVHELPPGDWRAHSLYLEIAAESGILGLSAFLAIVVLLLRRLWALSRRWLHTDEHLSDLAVALALGLVAYQVSGLFLHLNFQPYYWFLVALAGAAVHLLAAAQPRDGRAAPTPAEGPWLP